MERCQLEIETGKPSWLFIFEGLIAKCDQDRLEHVAMRRRKFGLAMSFWKFDTKVCDYIEHMSRRYNVPIDVVTWHDPEFAELISERLDHLDVPVRSVQWEIYEHLSPHVAVDGEVEAVFDANPAHRWGYGYKVREFYG